MVILITLAIVLIPSILLLGLGLWFASPNNETAHKISNKIPIKGISSKYTANYIGNWISMSWILYIVIIANKMSATVFVAVIGISIYALLKHISDATGKSLKETYQTFSFSKKGIRENIFVKFTCVISISMMFSILTFYILHRVF